MAPVRFGAIQNLVSSTVVDLQIVKKGPCTIHFVTLLAHRLQDSVYGWGELWDYVRQEPSLWFYHI